MSDRYAVCGFNRAEFRELVLTVAVYNLEQALNE